MENDAASDAPTFEQALDRLESIVERLEKGEASLKDSLTLYEEGVRLTRRCARGQVSQYRVGKGVPSSRIGGTVITAGRPRGHRTGTSTGARGGRPS